MCYVGQRGGLGAHTGLRCEGHALGAQRPPVDPVGGDDDDLDDACCCLGASSLCSLHVILSVSFSLSSRCFVFHFLSGSPLLLY